MALGQATPQTVQGQQVQAKEAEMAQAQMQQQAQAQAQQVQYQPNTSLSLMNQKNAERQATLDMNNQLEIQRQKDMQYQLMMEDQQIRQQQGIQAPGSQGLGQIPTEAIAQANQGYGGQQMGQPSGDDAINMEVAKRIQDGTMDEETAMLVMQHPSVAPELKAELSNMLQAGQQEPAQGLGSANTMMPESAQA